MTLLAVENLSVCYGDLYAVREVSFALQQDSVFVLLGANGAGKTSILRSISGLVPARGGAILAEGKSLIGLPPHQVARAGISHVPEGRRIFTHLTVEENLTVSFLADRAPVKLAQAFAAIYQLVPRLAERRRQAGGNGRPRLIHRAATLGVPDVGGQENDQFFFRELLAVRAEQVADDRNAA